jgi:UDPglucose 6-dehydrogenase
MGIESAEMVKHTINAFLATSVTFINEIAALCERVGVDAGEVEAGIRSEPRIGPRAYVTPGGAFGGGTLARDVAFLSMLAVTQGLEAPLIDAILRSNRQHGGWAFRRISELLGEAGSAPLKGVRVAVLGLTYKPNTSALRRSTGLELCRQLHAAGAEVRAFDPAVRELPPEFAGTLRLLPTAADAFDGADALVIATEWPEFAMLDPAVVGSAMRRAIVLDPNGLIARGFGPAKGVEYHRVGKAG